MFKILSNRLFGNRGSTVTNTILVVDDTETDRLFAQRVLEKKGYKIILASNGQMGIEMAKLHIPDLILLDFMMPDLNGPEVCKALKSNPKTENIPVIFLTSLETPSSVVDSFEKGADIFLNKPINANKLVAQISLTLNQKENIS